LDSGIALAPCNPRWVSLSVIIPNRIELTGKSG
jgi:hypothetical protein